ncbi:hypothetical protein PHLGIDRAFT_12581 [Phlebiopsis gigantea 11061_1 CR5-6]|uniref:Uncharacterized protein n=1 Tax=Phlebiopsis gigantea (strain 11061_1 CR5-6) TaxID=745531 RepID=A0A0C3PNP7_PHLG1|nr:hypothetical protein PHLGIDRAFT_12581 [Phlebiopsis gigantea 11061_1 CR5-6]
MRKPNLCRRRREPELAQSFDTLPRSTNLNLLICHCKLMVAAINVNWFVNMRSVDCRIGRWSTRAEKVSRLESPPGGKDIREYYTVIASQVARWLYSLNAFFLCGDLANLCNRNIYLPNRHKLEQQYASTPSSYRNEPSSHCQSQSFGANHPSSRLHSVAGLHFSPVCVSLPSGRDLDSGPIAVLEQWILMFILHECYA